MQIILNGKFSRVRFQGIIVFRAACRNGLPDWDQAGVRRSQRNDSLEFRPIPGDHVRFLNVKVDRNLPGPS